MVLVMTAAVIVMQPRRIMFEFDLIRTTVSLKCQRNLIRSTFVSSDAEKCMMRIGMLNYRPFCSVAFSKKRTEGKVKEEDYVWRMDDVLYQKMDV